jgi:subtilisin family serine protease
MASVFLMAACGGGGGGGGGGTSNPARPSEQAPSASSSQLPAVVVSEGEIAASAYIAQSGAKKAWDQGYGGKGVTVAVIDSGLAGEVSEFSGRVHGASGNFAEDANNAVIKNKPVIDELSHGTWVASVLGAGADNRNTVGVAPEATLLALGFFGKADVGEDDSFWINLDRLNQAFSDSRAAGASVVNGSFTLLGDEPSVRSALQQSVAANQVLVFAAGNEGEANPSILARYAKEDWAKGQIVAVGAVDRNNVIASYSNRAGDAMQFFLVARGDVQAVGRDGKVVSVMGTSFAAPQVSGAAALVRQKWPQLTAAKVADVLFTTATDLGDAGTDATYGRGLLNIDKAMQPIGQPTIALAGGGAVPVAATGLALPAGGIGGAVARASAQGAFTVAAVDSVGRDFKTDLAPRISRAASLVPGDLQYGLSRDIFGVERNFGGMRLSLTPSLQAAGDRSILAAGSYFGYGERSGWQFAGGSTDRLDQFFGLENRSRSQAHPYFNLARDGQFAGTGLALSDHSRIRAGALASATASGQVVDLAYSSRSRFQALPAAGDWSVALTAGNLAEKDRLLGMAGSGAFALAPGRSSFTTLGASYWLDPGTELGGSLTLGRTAGSGTGLLQFSPLTAWSAEARIARTGSWTPGDRLTFSVGRPMVISSGTLSMALPARISEDGRLGFRETRLDLRGGPAETRLGVSYAVPDSKSGRLSLNGMYRLNPENEPGRREALFGLQYQLRFH